MGSNWSWQLDLAEPLSARRVETVLELAAAAGLHLPEPLHAWGPAGVEADHRPIGRARLLSGLADGTWAATVWTADDVDMMITTTPTTVTLHLDAAFARRVPDPEADGFRLLHRTVTELWATLAERLDAVFGRVEDEWSMEQVWHTRPNLNFDPPPPGQWPELLGWWTYFDAERTELLPDPPARLRLTGRGSVLALLDDPAAVDALEFERLHRGLVSG
ncbi:hypothetical protein JOF53_005250 [Crossiella equi]|uniref:Immunity protein 52 domain-containing protein n=1 Tax=Crossiella equi TaxID=130796 RepID=A0ABS5AIH1_9PSEU|nr:hypothetical protein [Crossiella equi]MBP2476378.1 hypothetical protein [Crossiella equi]